MDLIGLKGMIFHGYHGVLKEEQTLGQKFIIDIELKQNLELPGKTDHLNDTINYVDIYNITKNIVENSSFNLLEKMAGMIAEAILEKLPVTEIKIKIEKPNVPIQGILNSAWVEISRSR
jgi:dihydroneopterin aldolase